MRNIIAATGIAFTALGLLCAAPASAAVTTEEAAALKTTLTPFGAEKAGNADGTIPAWTGGITSAPPGYKSGQRREDPFKAEKPLFAITAANVDKYAAKLTDGQIALLKKFPNLRMDVYPSHRTAAGTQWQYDSTFKNATTAKLENDGKTLVNAFGPIPFPIPKSGVEAMWNVSWMPMPVTYTQTFTGWLVDASGKAVQTTRSRATGKVRAFDPTSNYEEMMTRYNGIALEATVHTFEPPYKAGEAIIIKTAADYQNNEQKVWSYLTGQRRVRRVPNSGFDAPNPVNSGQGNMDELLVFTGSPERFDWKILGKRELYVPYNSLKITHDQPADKLGVGAVNPDYVRWELHRVWAVEGTLKQGLRHVVPRRIVYIDEDTWTPLIHDAWDARGQLWRHIVGYWFPITEVPTSMANTYALHNLLTGSYLVDGLYSEGEEVVNTSVDFPDKMFTPEGLASSGVR